MDKLRFDRKKLCICVILTIIVGSFVGCKMDPPIKILEDGFEFYRCDDERGFKCYSATYVGEEEHIVVPAKTKEGYPVYQVAGYVGMYNQTVKSITVSEGIYIVGEYAFYGFSKLEEVIFPKSTTYINENGIFSGCSSLVKISFAKQNKRYSVEDNCLIEKQTRRLIAGCNSSIIPEDITEICPAAFCGAALLETVKLPNGITRIENYTFSKCTSLQSIEIPSTVREIGVEAFGSCKNLSQITIPQSVTKIEDFAFYGCNKLTELRIPENVTELGRCVVPYVKSLTIYTECSEAPSGWDEDWVDYAGCEENAREEQHPKIVWKEP